MIIVTLENLHNAAPDLLDVARRILRADDCQPNNEQLREHWGYLVVYARLAIEKAEGQR